MSAYSKVVWSEGLFLQPQHFQQQDRYFERYVETRCGDLTPYGWGLAELEFERELLGIGKLGLRRAVGVFPDGTPLRIPDDEPLPPAIDVPESARDQVVHLAVPLRRGDSLDVDRGTNEELARHLVREHEARDASATSGTQAVVEVGGLRTRLLFGSAVSEAYAAIPVARVVEVRSDRRVVLEDEFIPTVLQARASTRLVTFLNELLGLLNQRGDYLAGHVAATGRGGAAEIADFLLLQIINRWQPLVAHCADTARLHPEALYRLCVSLAGELATFNTETKRAPSFPGYRHDRLRESFEPVMAFLNKVIPHVVDRVAVPIPIEPKRFGMRVASVGDRTLFSSAVFVLAARADVPAEDLRRRFPTQIRIAPSDKITNLVNLQLPGVPIHPLPAAPRQLPFHAGFVYFEVDATSDLWTQVKTTGTIAMHVAGDLPGLALEFWAIRA